MRIIAEGVGNTVAAIDTARNRLRGNPGLLHRQTARCQCDRVLVADAVGQCWRDDALTRLPEGYRRGGRSAGVSTSRTTPLSLTATSRRWSAFCRSKSRAPVSPVHDAERGGIAGWKYHRIPLSPSNAGCAITFAGTRCADQLANGGRFDSGHVSQRNHQRFRLRKVFLVRRRQALPLYPIPSDDCSGTSTFTPIAAASCAIGAVSGERSRPPTRRHRTHATCPMRAMPRFAINQLFACAPVRWNRNGARCPPPAADAAPLRSAISATQPAQSGLRQRHAALALVLAAAILCMTCRSLVALEKQHLRAQPSPA